MSKLGTLVITGEVFDQHETGNHPERALRTQMLQQMATKLVEHDSRFTIQPPTPADLELVKAVHSPIYVDILQEYCAEGGGMLDLNTQVSKRSYEVALNAAGGIVQTVEAVMTGAAKNGFALVRPPGHHAVPQAALGFCLFNNVAIAAQYLLDKHGLERVLIVDWDVHHGNGTQDIFYEDPRVMFFSTHQAPLYPGTGALHETGSGKANGYTVNLPLPAGCDDAVLNQAYENVLDPLVERFKPEFILVSAGYDGHWRDPLAQLNLTTPGYAGLTQHLCRLAETFCGGRIALTLEGGYELHALTSAVRASLLSLAGSDIEEAAAGDSAGLGMVTYTPNPSDIKNLLREAQNVHKISRVF